MAEQGISLDSAEAPGTRGIPLLILTTSDKRTDHLQRGLGPRFLVEVFASEFEAGQAWDRLRPEIVVLDTGGAWREALLQIRSLEVQPILVLGWPRPEPSAEVAGNDPTFDGYIPATSPRIEAIRSRILMAYLDAWMAARS